MIRKIAALAVMGALSAGAVGVSTLPASAQQGMQDDQGRWYNPNGPRPGGNNNGGWNNGPGNGNGPGWNNNRGRGNNWNGFGPGALFGFGLGAVFGQPGWYQPAPPVYRPPPPAYRPPPMAYPPYGGRPPVYGNWQAHVAWCQSRYRTYSPATNTYYIRVGVPAVCHSPYA